MFELNEIFETWGRRMFEKVLWIEHPSSRIQQSAALEAYAEFWRELQSTPALLERGHKGTQQLKAAAINLLRNQLNKVGEYLRRQQVWDANERHAIVAWVRSELGLRS